jgi:hypothetical protein
MEERQTYLTNVTKQQSQKKTQAQPGKITIPKLKRNTNTGSLRGKYASFQGKYR